MSVSVLSWLLIVGRTRPLQVPNHSHQSSSIHPTRRRLALIQTRAADKDPPYPVLRASPYPKVTDLICRLPSHTWFYRLEAVNLGDLMRLWVRPDVVNNSIPQLFKGQEMRTGPTKTCELFQNIRPISGWTNSRAVILLKRKDNSSRGTPQRHWVQLRYRTLSTLWLRNINLIPFRALCKNYTIKAILPALRID